MRPEETYRTTTDRNERRRIQAEVLAANREHVVWFVRKTVAPQHRAEAVQVGLLGVLIALEKYDREGAFAKRGETPREDRGAAFWFFASKYVHKEIQKWMDVAVYWRKTPNQGKSPARRVAFEAAKAQRKHDPLEEPGEVLADAPTVEELVADAESKALLHAFAAGLSTEDRELLFSEKAPRSAAMSRQYLSLVAQATAFIRGNDDDATRGKAAE